MLDYFSLFILLFSIQLGWEVFRGKCVGLGIFWLCVWVCLFVCLLSSRTTTIKWVFLCVWRYHNNVVYCSFSFSYKLITFCILPFQQQHPLLLCLTTSAGRTGSCIHITVQYKCKLTTAIDMYLHIHMYKNFTNVN